MEPRVKYVQIRGRKYNVNKAVKVAESRTDRWTEVLYRKKNGEYFIVGVGPTFPDGMFSPQSQEEAETWAVDRMGKSLEKLLKEDSRKPVLMSLKVPASFREKLRQAALDKNISMTDYVVNSVTEAIDKTR